MVRFESVGARAPILAPDRGTMPERGVEKDRENVEKLKAAIHDLSSFSNTYPARRDDYQPWIALWGLGGVG